jgi:hypothetical protein
MNFGEPHGAELTGMEDVAAERVGVPWRSSRIIRNGVGDPRRLHLDHVSAHAADRSLRVVTGTRRPGAWRAATGTRAGVPMSGHAAMGTDDRRAVATVN